MLPYIPMRPGGAYGSGGGPGAGPGVGVSEATNLLSRMIARLEAQGLTNTRLYAWLIRQRQALSALRDGLRVHLGRTGGNITASLARALRAGGFALAGIEGGIGWYCFFQCDGLVDWWGDLFSDIAPYVPGGGTPLIVPFSSVGGPRYQPSL